MSCRVKELREFLAALNDDDEIGIDEGGLTLIVRATDEDDIEKCTDFDGVLAISYFEIGGVEEDGWKHPSGNLDNYHVECGKLPACECGMALAEANCCCSGTKEEVAGYVKALKKAGWKGAHAVEGSCPSTK